MLRQSDRLQVRPHAAARAVDPRCLTDSELALLARDGAARDPIALAHLVDRFDHRLRAVARSYRLDPWDVDDVIQGTWEQFLRHGQDLRDPAAVGGWLATTARRMSLRVLQRHQREQLSEDPTLGHAGDHAEPDRELIAAERRELLHGALADLPNRQRMLMRLLLTRPDLSYEEVGKLLAVPVGSIGPTRARGLGRLRCCAALRALHAAGA